MTTADEFWAKLDALGAEQVRANLASNVYLGPERSLAAAWVERSNERTSAEQLALARRAAAEAHTANTIAKIALAVAIVAAIASIVAVVIAVILRP